MLRSSHTCPVESTVWLLERERGREYIVAHGWTESVRMAVNSGSHGWEHVDVCTNAQRLRRSER